MTPGPQRFIVPALLLNLLVAASCGQNDHAAAARPPVAPVVVADVRQMPVPLEIRAIGNVEANSTVEIKSQVSGQLQKVFFTEGDEVREGQLLFQIDPRQLQQAVSEAEAALENANATVGQAQANYERDLAQAKNARSQADRYAQLATQGIISREANENYHTQADAAERVAAASKAAIASAASNVRAAAARLADAKLQLAYASIEAPVSGKTGKLAVKPGNLVQANSATPLVVIAQLAPVFANFTIPEQQFSLIRSYASRGKLTVQAYPGNNSPDAGPVSTPAVGTLDFFDNQVDTSTGTILLRARFPNTDHRLWPGQFVNVVVRLDVPTATVIPTAAVSSGQNGRYVFVVKPDLTAEQRTIQSSRDYQDLTVVNSGVAPGERVIVRGQLRVQPGSKVEIVKDNQQQGAAQTQ